MILKGRVWKFGDNISTDHIVPGRFFHLRSNLDELKKHIFEDLHPGFYKKIQKGDVIFAGRNFGVGSSREHAPLTIKLAGIDAVIAPSFARIFFRNAINVGLCAIICDADEVKEGDHVEIDIEAGLIKNLTQGFQKTFQPLSGIMKEILKEGGLVNYIKKKGGFKV
jgi:3-isopropylmalate/(R)-2-methylmalate dehydratase small subunit